MRISELVGKTIRGIGISEDEVVLIEFEDGTGLMADALDIRDHNDEELNYEGRIGSAVSRQASVKISMRD